MTNSNSLQKCDVFNFNATHNGIQCIQSLKAEDQGTEHQVWFTRKMLAEIFDVGLNTISRHVEALESRGVLSDVQNWTSFNFPDSTGKENIKTTLYDLKVFNFLAMRLDTDRAWEVKEKFNDILVKEETNAKNTLPAVSEEDHFFLNILHADSKEETALALKDYKTYRDEMQREVEQERDEAVRKRKAINDKRTATLMVAKREDNKKINQLICENKELKEQNEILKVSIGESNQWMSSAQIIQNFKLHRRDGNDVKPKTLTIMLKKCGCRHRESEFPDAKGFKYAIFFVEDVKKALNIF